MKNKHLMVLSFLVLLCLTLSGLPAAAQGENLGYEGPIMNVDLGITSLSLSVGESYTFQVTFEPEDNPFKTLKWFVTDESVIQIDPLTDTVAALADGEACIYVETLDQAAHAVCNVTVGDSASKDASVMKSGDEYFNLTQKEMRKITSTALKPYLDFIADSSLTAKGFETLTDRSFDVLAAVKPGMEEAESRRARSLGMQSDPLTSLNSITLIGSVDQILSFVKDNKDLREVFDLGAPMAPDPDAEVAGDEIESGEKAFGLQGNANNLSNFTYAQRLGLNGSGRTIAVIDTGLDVTHEQFTRRIKYEACFSNSGSGYYTACNNNATTPGSSRPIQGKVLKLNSFNHGTHVTGIAAGRDGVAPKANIVFIAAASETRWTCKSNEKHMACTSGSAQCCQAQFYSSNQAKAYDYLLKLAAQGVKIDAVNMSYGSLKYTGICDSSDKYRKEYFDKLVAADMLPVVSAGNDSYNDSVGRPGCVSSAYTVAALADMNVPRIASYSNFNKPNIDIAAPGTKIWSAVQVKNNCTRNCYDYKSGTSMAAPMVTGSIAMVRQLYPNATAVEAGKMLKDMTSKTVNKRVNSKNEFLNSWYFSKPVLNLNNILNTFTIRDNNVRAQNQQVLLTLEPIGLNRSFTYKINVIDLASKAKVPCRFRVTTLDGFKTIEIDGKGNFKSGKIYRVEVSRYMKGMNKPAKTVKYFTPFLEMTSLTAVPRGQGVDLNLYSGSQDRRNFDVIYTVYDASTGDSVKIADAGNQSLPKTITGLTNGKKYYVTATPFRNIMVNKKTILLLGKETAPVYFVPLSAPFNCREAAWSVPQLSGQHYTKISCVADPAADGIAVFYRNYEDNNQELKLGCTSEKGKPFVCQIDGVDRGNKYQFIILKYKQEDSGWQRFSESTVINHNCGNADLKPEKTMIYVKENDEAVISAAESSKAIGITAYRQDADGNFLVDKPFCNENRRSCSGHLTGLEGGAAAFYVTRWTRDENGKLLYSPGVYANNLWNRE